MTKSIHWDITRNCNLRCKHCYNADKYFDKSSENYISQELDLNSCMKIVEKFYRAGFTHIHFLGGEPLSSPNIFKIIEKAKQLDMYVTINSNACLLDKEMQEKLISLGIDHFAASLDGCTAKTNDSIRGVGTFEKVISNMKELNERKKQNSSQMQTALVYTLTKKNVTELPLLPKLAKELGIDLIVLTTFIESGQGKKNREEFNIDYYNLCDAIESMVSKELSKYDISLQIDMRPRFCEYLSLKYSAPIIYNQKNSMCCAGEEIWYMEANGDVHPCLVFQLDIGKDALENQLYEKEKINIECNNIDDIVHSQYWKTFLDKKHKFEVSKIPTCDKCNYLSICQPCFLEFNNYNKPILECEWTKSKENELFESLIGKNLKIYNEVELDERKMIVKEGVPIIKLENEVSLKLWNYVYKSNTIEEILKMLIAEYEIEEKYLKIDIVMFLYLLKKYNIIVF